MLVNILGSIVTDYLNSEDSAEEFVEKLSKKCGDYNGFQFLAFDRFGFISFIEIKKYSRTPEGHFELTTLVHKFVDEVKPRKWSVEEGVLGFGNSPPEKPYKKVIHGTEIFKNSINKIKSLSSEEKVIEELLKIARDRTQ